MEPRQWSHLPKDSNFFGLAYANAQADIGVDPVLELEGATMDVDAVVAKYIRTFELFGQSARVDYAQGYSKAKWQGLLEGNAAEVEREGLSDGFLRFAVNLFGAPPLSGKDYAAFRADNSSGTIIGAGLVLRVPTGEYKNDKLLNLGGNRFVVRPQFGVSHYWGKWTVELTGEVSLFEDNDDFFAGNRREQDPLWVVHSHIIYSFRPGLSVGVGTGYDYGGETAINGTRKDDEKQNFGWGINASYPINRVLGIKLSYVNTRTQQPTGSDVDTLVASLSYMW